MTGAWRDKAGFVGEGDELGAVAAGQLAEDAADVRLGGQRADHEPPRDFVVGQAGGDEAEDLVFALGELVELGGALTRIGP